MKRKSLLPSLIDELQRFGFFEDFDTPLTATRGLQVYEDADYLHVEAEMPGVPAEAIEISLERGVLRIKGEIVPKETNVKYHLQSERSFSYQLPLPTIVDDKEQPKAKCQDGILKITFSKHSSATARKIDVEVG